MADHIIRRRALAGLLLIAALGLAGCARLDPVQRRLDHKVSELPVPAQFRVNVVSFNYWAGEATVWLRETRLSAEQGDPLARQYLKAAQSIGAALDEGAAAIREGATLLEQCVETPGGCDSVSVQLLALNRATGLIQRTLWQTGALGAAQGVVGGLN